MRTILTLIIWILNISPTFSQEKFHINDPIDPFNPFRLSGSKMLDTNFTKFQQAKKNVIDYCNQKLEFKIEDLAFWYSCREYFETSDNKTKEERESIRKEGLKYQFFIIFRVKDSIEYNLNFYLDSSLNVVHTSKWIFEISPEVIWAIQDWSSVKIRAIKYRKGWILPIEDIDLKYSAKYEQFVYILSQEKIKTKMTSAYTGKWKKHILIVSSMDGKILEKSVENGDRHVTPF